MYKPVIMASETRKNSAICRKCMLKIPRSSFNKQLKNTKMKNESVKRMLLLYRVKYTKQNSQVKLSLLEYKTSIFKLIYQKTCH